MGKKNLNPADAYRKALRKKELKKNKSERSKARDLTLVKKSTWDLEDEIQRLEEANEPSEKSRLLELKAELERINKKKAEYVAENPEHRRLVYRPRPKDGDTTNTEIILPKRKLFNKKGLPRHPERSIYYDPVMNPFGVAPPGMPYAERTARPGEIWSDEESVDDDDDIPMPAGPPPGTCVEDDGDVEDIPMPDGPPPGQLFEGSSSLVDSSLQSPPFSSVPSPLDLSGHPSSDSFLIPGPAPPPPPATGFINAPRSFIPVPAPPFPLVPLGGTTAISTPFLHHPMGYYPYVYQTPPTFPNAPLTTPHRNSQAPQERKHSFLGHPSLPLKPPISTSVSDRSRTQGSGATVQAAPQLRDLKREATAFVPSVVKRKKMSSLPSSKINAAPVMGEKETGASLQPTRPDLLNTLKERFGTAPTVQKDNVEPKNKSDYDNFLEEMSDILGPNQ